MLRRILCLTLALILSLSVVSVSYAETTWDKEVESKAMVLKGIGVVNMAEDGNWSAFRNMSKSAFINFLCNLLDEGSNYTEIYNEDAIKQAEDAGLIHPGQTDLNKPLYYDEAMTMLVRLLGYELHAQRGGGYPSGYISIANRLGLADGISASAGERFKEYDAINLLYNAINCPTVEIVSISDEGIVYGNTSDKTFLYEYRHIYKVEGTVDATETAALRSNLSVAEDQIIIDGYLYQTEEDFSHLIGMNAEAYVKDNKDGLDTVLYVLPRLNEEITIHADDLLSVNVTGNKIESIEYIDKNDNDKKVTMASSLAVMRNGQPLKGYTKTDFEIADGTIRLIDNGGDKRYEVAIITDFKTMIINRISMMGETIDNLYTFDTNNQTLNVKEEQGSVIRILDADGNQLDLDALVSGGVLKIAQSVVDGRNVVTAYYSDTKISGTVESIHTKDDTYVVIGGVEYTLAEVFEQAIANADPKAKPLKPGSVYTFYLDSEGEIVYATEKSEGMQYGIVMATGSDGTFNKNCYIKLFTTEGEWKELTFADKIVFNDIYGATHKGYRPDDTMLNQIGTGQNNQTMVIAYTTNEQGKINRLDLPITYIDGTEDKFNVKEQPVDATSQTGERKQIAYRGNNRSFDSDVYIEDTAVMWMVDANNKGLEESYVLITNSDLAGDTNYTVTAYSVDEFGFADLIVVNDKGSGYGMFINNGGLFVVKNIGEAMGPNGEVVATITGATGKYDEVTYFCEDDTILNKLSFGDVTTLYVDKKGFVIQVAEPYCKLSDVSDLNTFYSLPGSMHGRPVILRGEVEYNDPTNLRIKIDCGPNTDDSRALRLDPGSVVFIVDVEDRKINRGSINDIEIGDKIITKIVMSGIWGAYVVFR